MTGQLYWPIFKAYPETAFGGIFETEAEYRDPAVKEMIAKSGGWVLWPPIRFSYNTQNKNPPMAFPVKPTWMLTDEDCKLAIERGFHPCDASLEWNWLGTDDQGRDVIARVLYGFRLSVLFGLALTLFASVIGVAAGATQGYFGGWTDLLFQRFIEIWTSVPTLYLLIIVAAVITPGFWILLGIQLAFAWVALVGVVRAEFLRARNLEYVTAARALGLSNGKIIFRHLLPNAMVATLTFVPFILNGSITTLTSLDFLGFGLPPGSPRSANCYSKARTIFRRHGWRCPRSSSSPSCSACSSSSAKPCATRSTRARPWREARCTDRIRIITAMPATATAPPTPITSGAWGSLPR